MPVEAISENGFILTLTVITTFDWLNDVANLRHNTFPMSTSPDETAFAFDFFDAFMPLNLVMIDDK